MWKAFLAFLRAIFGKKKPKPDIPDVPVQKWVKIWICWDNQRFLSRKDCRKGVLMEFKKGFEPTELCKIDHSPVPNIEYVYVDVCKDSMFLPNQYCPLDKIEGSKKYAKGFEPKEKCDIHKKVSPIIEYEYHDVCIDSGLLKDQYCPVDRVLNKKYEKHQPGIPSTFCTFHKKPDVPVFPKLQIIGDRLFYGDVNKFCGASRREAWWRKIQPFGFVHDWGNKSLEWYEDVLINSGINYVYHWGVRDTRLMEASCRKFRDAGIIVEIGCYRVGGPGEGILVNLDEMGDLAELGNVFFDCQNEFIGSDQTEIIKVINIAETLKDQGCLISAGAWSGPDGKAMSDVFHDQYSSYHIRNHHRDWNGGSFSESKTHGKPVAFNEFFSQGNKTLQQIKDIIETSMSMGIATCYYGFRWLGLSDLSKIDSWQDSEEYNDELLVFIKNLLTG